MPPEAPFSAKVNADKLVSRVFWLMVSFGAFLFLADIFINRFRWIDVGSIRRLANITREDGMQNWFSSTQLLLVGAVLWLIVWNVKNNDRESGKWKGWAMIAAFFTYLGFDDGTKFHERVGTAVKTWFEDSSLVEFFPSYEWHIVFGPIFTVMGIFILWFLWKELDSASLKGMLLLAMGLYILAMGMDFIEGLDDPYDGLGEMLSKDPDSIKHYSKLVEETVENFATTLFLVIFLKKLLGLSSEWKIQIESGKKTRDS